jgi:hypothetical protein
MAVGDRAVAVAPAHRGARIGPRAPIAHGSPAQGGA